MAGVSFYSSPKTQVEPRVLLMTSLTSGASCSALRCTISGSRCTIESDDSKNKLILVYIHEGPNPVPSFHGPYKPVCVVMSFVVGTVSSKEVVYKKPIER
jgi:hypothetical protein